MLNDQDYELLSAYLDNEFDADAQTHVKTRLLQDPEFNQEYQALKQMQNALQQASDKINDTPVPDALTQLLQQTPDEISGDSTAKESAQSNVTPLPSKDAQAQAKSAKAWWRQPWLYPVAACALIALVTTLQSPFPSNSHNQGNWGKIASLMHSLPSSELMSLEDAQGTRIMPMQSFVHQDGRLCREFHLASDTQNQHGIACKSGAGWQQEILVNRTVDKSNYQPASRDTDNVDQYLQNYLKRPLSEEQELQAIKEKWQ